MRVEIEPTIPESAWIADTATVRGWVTLGEEVSVWFSAVIRGEDEPVMIGDRTNVQDGAGLHVSEGCPCLVGNDVTIGHLAIVHGCTVEDGALIGMHATVLDGARIGKGAVVGAGALVPPGMHVPAGTLALGVPAKVIGPLKPAQQGLGRSGAAHYAQLKEQFRQGKF